MQVRNLAVDLYYMLGLLEMEHGGWKNGCLEDGVALSIAITMIIDDWCVRAGGYAPDGVRHHRFCASPRALELHVRGCRHRHGEQDRAVS
jgi:hypothetical protein